MCSSVQKRPKKISSFKDKHVFCVIICSLIFEIPIFFTLILDNYLVFFKPTVFKTITYFAITTSVFVCLFIYQVPF